MKILKIFGAVLGAILVILLVLILIQPGQGHIGESIVIKAPDSVVFKEVNSFKTFNSWSAWAKMDTAAKYTFSGPETGVGAKMEWDGPTIGKGSQWIIESVPNRSIKCGLDFGGMEGEFFAGYELESLGDSTRFTWTYDGPNTGLGGKAFWLFASGSLTEQYRSGLVDFKNMIEGK